MLRKRLILTTAALAAALPLAGQQPPPEPHDPIVAADQKILAEVAEHSEQMENLRTLTDVIGARLTGTAATRRANEWTAERFRAYGLANVHLESWTIPHSWQRGTARARVVAPVERALDVQAAGWTINTAGPVRGPLVYVKAETKEELEAYRGKLRGALVILGEPNKRERVTERPLQPKPYKPEPNFEAQRKFGQEREAFLRDEGVVGLLRDSDKSFGLFNMSSAGRDFNPSLIPTAFTTPESYDLLWRLLQKEKNVEVELTIEGCAFSDGPVEVFNTVAEIPGSEKPDEIVVVGAHLDSWDLANGATDNGTGTSVILEAARVLRKLDLKPKRTLRFILFTGEEQGLHGSKAYVEAHKSELDKISAAIVHDGGTGRVDTLALQGNPQVYDIVKKMLAPLRQMIGLEELSLRSISGS
ncbi:MAG: M20/M25/M40 family metallo-hydrolase, partial [Candidatus Acidiferrales bacterium]